MHQLPALYQHSRKSLCPFSSEIIIPDEIKVHQLWALCQHSCKPLCILSFHFTTRPLDCCDASPVCHHHELSHQELELFIGRVIVGVVPEDPEQEDNDRQSHLVYYQDSLTPSDVLLNCGGPDCRPSPVLECVDATPGFQLEFGVEAPGVVCHRREVSQNEQ